MRLNYHYKKTDEISRLIGELDAIKEICNNLPSRPYFENQIRRRSFLNSAVFSARIEGNELTHEDVATLTTNKNVKSTRKREIQNLLKATEWIYSEKAHQKVSRETILSLHKTALSAISDNVGAFRDKPGGVFNRAGFPVYVAPAPKQIPDLIKEFVRISNSTEEPGPITAATSHFAFEKIHPFIDGNGRVGRLLSTLILKNRGFGFKGLASSEVYLDKHRAQYYDLLEINDHDITEFIEFFVKALSTQVRKMVKKLSNPPSNQKEEMLLPRRREILEMIREHNLVSFDFVRRRFQKVPSSTLHNDIKKLLDSNLIIKLGSTRGAVYSLPT